MHIVIDARLYGLEHAGIGRYNLNLIKYLSLLDHTNTYTIIKLSKTRLPKLPANFTSINSDIRHYSVKEQINFLFLLNSLQADLFHFPHFNVPLGFTKPFIVTIHDLLWHEKIGLQVTTLPPLLYLVKYCGYRLVSRASISKSKAILTPTKYVKHQILSRYPWTKGKITVTYESVDEVYLKPFTPDAEVIKDLGISKPYSIYTGSLYPHKNVESVLKALLLLDEVVLVISSARNAFTQKFMQRVSALGLKNRVVFLGFVPDEKLKTLYAHSLCLIQPSLSEGFGLTGLEAMAAGAAVICSQHPVLKEVYGESALFVDTSQPELIAEAIHRLLDDNNLKRQLITSGKTQVTRYSWQKLAEQTKKLYETYRPA